MHFFPQKSVMGFFREEFQQCSVCVCVCVCACVRVCVCVHAYGLFLFQEIWLLSHDFK